MHRCGLGPPPAIPLIDAEGSAVRADFERGFRTLRSLPVDIWLTAHGREFGRWRKFQERARAADPAAPFIDRDGYFESIDNAEAKLRKPRAEQ